MAGRTKYRNVKTTVDGVQFDSKAEAKRYRELYLLRIAGEIDNLKLQPRYPLMCGANHIRIRNKHGQPRNSYYYADFEYRDCKSKETIVEDVKGFDTPVSRLKRAIIEAQTGVRVVIVR